MPGKSLWTRGSKLGVLEVLKGPWKPSGPELAQLYVNFMCMHIFPFFGSQCVPSNVRNLRSFLWPQSAGIRTGGLCEKLDSV